MPSSAKVSFGLRKLDFWGILSREREFESTQVRFQLLLIGNRRKMYLSDPNDEILTEKCKV
ncbi:hypothetical protein EPI10_031193 [Gossypium australe]|uniref:Uncharacterized protein n=1 Tax=Gossypium australe TaxID=47621 RepID=A0A5B6X236_9ROSI|nr:hypothetical protein EPI10_031193 [Gossypium australe]